MFSSSFPEELTPLTAKNAAQQKSLKNQLSQEIVLE